MVQLSTEMIPLIQSPTRVTIVDKCNILEHNRNIPGIFSSSSGYNLKL